MTKRLHKFHHLGGWPTAVYEGEKQLVCDDDYVQVSEVFYVATDRPQDITFKVLNWNAKAGGALTLEALRSLRPDERERWGAA